MPQRGCCQLSPYHTERDTHTPHTRTHTHTEPLFGFASSGVSLPCLVSVCLKPFSGALLCSANICMVYPHIHAGMHVFPSPQVSVGRGCDICAGIQFLPLGENCDNSHLHFSFCFSFPFFPLIDSAVCICEGKGTSFMKWPHFMRLFFVITQPQVELSWG